MREGGARARRAAVVWRQQTDISVIAIIPARTLWQGGSLRQWAATTAAVTRGYGNVHGYDGSGSVDSGNGSAKSVVTEAVAELMEVAVTRGGSGWLRHSAAPTFTLVLHYPHRIHTRHITKQFTFITLITRSHATHHRTYAPSPNLSLTHSLTHRDSPTASRRVVRLRAATDQALQCICPLSLSLCLPLSLPLLTRLPRRQVGGECGGGDRGREREEARTEGQRGTREGERRRERRYEFTSMAQSARDAAAAAAAPATPPPARDNQISGDRSRPTRPSRPAELHSMSFDSFSCNSLLVGMICNAERNGGRSRRGKNKEI